jgi:hypothetical protein
MQLLWLSYSVWGLILIPVRSLRTGRGRAEPAKSPDERSIVTLVPVMTEGPENPLFLTQTSVRTLL